MLDREMKNLRTLTAGHVIQSHQLIQQIELEETKPPALVTGLVFALSALVVLIIVGTNVVTVEETATAAGKVIPEGDVLAVQNLEGGIIKDIMVKEGQIVQAGQPLVRLSPVDADAALQQLRAKFVAAQMEIERLNAMTEGRKPDFSPYASEFPDLARHQRELYSSEYANFSARTNILESQLRQQYADRNMYQNKIESLKKQIALLTDELNVQEGLAKKGLGARANLLSVRRQLNATQGDFAQTKDMLARTAAAIAEAREKLAEAKTNFAEKSMTQVGEKAIEAAQLKEAIRAQTDRAKRRVVIAPVKGIVQSLKVNGIDTVVQPGAPIAEILPITDRLFITAKIDPKDIGRIKPGQNVDINITAFDFSTYGSLPGALIKLSATTFQTERGEQYYLATIEPERTWLGGKDNPQKLMPGMIANVNIKTGKKSIFRYLMKPVYRGFSHAFTER